MGDATRRWKTYTQGLWDPDKLEVKAIVNRNWERVAHLDFAYAASANEAHEPAQRSSSGASKNMLRAAIARLHRRGE